MTRALITGGAGFIGHHLVQYLLEKTDWELVLLDRLDLSGTLSRIAELPAIESGAARNRIRFVYHDFKAPISEHTAARIGDVEYILHLGASTHVDRSIADPLLFVTDNVVGTANLLEHARTQKNLKCFVNFSTDEVFGPAPEGYAHREDEAYRPSNPYSASKAGAASMGYAYHITYKLPVITTYAMNNFGERQHPEKLVPKTIRSVLRGEPMPIFATIDPTTGWATAIGSRYWIHCRNTASAVLFLLRHGVPGESYNIVGSDELTNLEMAERIARIVGKPLIPEFVDFHKTRPGHDRRYALDGTKLKTLGWVPEVAFEDSLRNTVEFSLRNSQWI